MKVLLVHPEDSVASAPAGTKFDLVVDLARAPRANYERWSSEMGCGVKSIFDSALAIPDLFQIREVLQGPKGRLVDRHGIDWWDLASYLLGDDVFAVILLRRLAKEIGRSPELFSTRPDVRGQLLADICGGRLVSLRTPRQSITQKFQHYAHAFSRLDRPQIMQVIGDKWDSQHLIRRRMGRRWHDGEQPVVLLPTSYVNVTKTEMAYARLLPDQQFLLVHARQSGKPAELPPNIRLVPLHPYFPQAAAPDLPDLLRDWALLKRRLMAECEAFSELNALGALEKITRFVRSGVAVRDAWSAFFASHNIVGCLSADDTVLYTRLPLVLSELRGIPSATCHHGVLDCRVIQKTLYSESYLAKSEMEQDYLVNTCQVDAQRIVLGGPGGTPVSDSIRSRSGSPWLVFFTEPFDADNWRKDEIYHELLPALLELARQSGLELVFKLHPFESAKGHRNLLARFLSPDQMAGIKIVTGIPAPDFWAQIRIAITVQSSVAVECTRLGIPVFLCAWLEMRFGSYITQYAKFGVGQILSSVQDLKTVPERAAKFVPDPSAPARLGTTMDLAVLQELLGATSPMRRA